MRSPSSLHQKCYYQIIYAKLNLKIHYPPSYDRETWHYKYANTDLIQETINYYPWERSPVKRDVNEKVYIFAEAIQDIFSNFIPHETILCNNRDPPCISNKIKKLTNEKNTAYHTNPIFKMVKKSNNSKYFRPFKICYYLQLNFQTTILLTDFWKN